MNFTEKQDEANALIAGPATHILTYGGSRSGKTFLHVRNIVFRALKSPKSRHVILRFRYNHVKSSIIYDTFPKVMEECYKGVDFVMNKTDSFATFGNGSEIWFGGLDESDRVEKILGNEYSTIFLNECSQLSNQARETVTTRLAQKVYQKLDGSERKLLKQKMYYDCNPPTKGHWTYKLFFKHQDPETRQKVNHPSDYVHIQMNPLDNKENLTDGYINTLKSLSTRMRKRFWEGEFADDNPFALFSEVTIDQYRVMDADLPEFVRIVVPVDPSGSGDKDNQNNDAIGICVVALGTDGNVYLLEDCTVKAGPKVWGGVATGAYDRHKADMIVAESNFGGDMVKFTIQTSKPNVPYKAVHASRGKTVRAEPVAALYEQGKVRHVGKFPDLEEELYGFTQNGYTGERSPNRADALIWGITELFPGVVKEEVEEEEDYFPVAPRGADSWMS